MFKKSVAVVSGIIAALLLCSCFRSTAPEDFSRQTALIFSNKIKETQNLETTPVTQMPAFDKKVFTADAGTLALYNCNETCGSILLDATTRWNGQLGTATRCTGVFKGGLSLRSGCYSKFDTIIPDGTADGTIETYINFDPAWDSNAAYAFFGNNGARCNLMYNNRTLVFQKNHSNIFKQVSGIVSLEPNRWYHVAGTWGKRGMRLYLDGTQIASNQDYSAYQSSPRGSQENSFVAGWKTPDGMGALDIYSTIYMYGSIDKIRISNIDRFNRIPKSCDKPADDFPVKCCSLFTQDNSTVFLANFNNSLRDMVTSTSGVLTAGSFVNSLYCNGIRFDPPGDEKGIFRFPETERLKLSAGTLEALVYCESVSSDFNHIIDKSWQYGLTVYDGYLAVHFGHWWYSSVKIPLKQWCYIAASYNGSAIRIYLNGNALDSTSYSGNGSPSFDLGIGNSSAESHDVPFFGIIDEIRISNTPRSPAQIGKIGKDIRNQH